MPTARHTLLLPLACISVAAMAPVTAVAEDPVSGCPQAAPVKRLHHGLPGTDAPATDPLVYINSEKVSAQIGDHYTFTDKVELRRDTLSVYADEITFNQTNNHIEAQGNISLGTRNGDSIYTPQLNYALDTETGYTTRSQFTLADGAARGDAATINIGPNGELVLENMHFTTCPPESDDWVLSGRRLKLDREAEIGTARDVTVRFMHVPIFYTPYFSFPLTEERKSGFLVPNIGHSSKRGLFLNAPYYFNIAPSYDDTLTPRYMSRRGLQLQNEFRYLGKPYSGSLDLEYLPNDLAYGDYRAAAKFLHSQTFSQHWSGNIDLKWVSDSSYLVDLGDSIAATSATVLPRSIDALYHGNIWRFGVRALTYQTVDPTIAPTDLPYDRLPQVLLSADAPSGPNRPRYQLDSEWVNFSRSEGISGQRLDITPSVSLPLTNAYAFFTPKIGYRYTAYNLNEGADTTPQRGLPIYSLDTGLIFEREGLLRAREYRQTLEPRLFYLYVPYENQDALPNFDTGIPDFSYYNLFRENRFVGADRVGDANQATLGLMSRFLDTRTGTEQVRLSLGQIIYIENPRVALPGTTAEQKLSNLVAEVYARLGPYWYVRGGLQWDNKEYITEKSNILLQYHPDKKKILTLGYRYNKYLQEQTYISAQWPLATHWTALASWNYSLPDKTTLHSYAGFEYTNCCWAFRITKGQRILADGTTDNPILFELELTGLAKLGPRPESPLKEGSFAFE